MISLELHKTSHFQKIINHISEKGLSVDLDWIEFHLRQHLYAVYFGQQDTPMLRTRWEVEKLELENHLRFVYGGNILPEKYQKHVSHEIRDLFYRVSL